MGGYEFVGWFTAESGGTQVTNYNGTSNTTLHAQYTNNYATLLSGRNFNSKLRNFASPMYNSENPDVILTFRKATLAEYNDASSELTSYNIVSDSSSPNYVYLWKSGNDVLYYSEADTIYMDEDCTNMFWAVGLSYIDLSGLNSSKVTTMETMFSGNYGLKSINFANLNTSNVQDFNDMFYECYIPTINMSGINTQSATNMQGMFAYTSKLTSLDISNFDTSNVTDFGGMFMSSNIPSLDVSRFNTSSATTMNGMFYNDENLTTIDVSSFNTSNVTDFGNMFSMLHITSLDLSNFDTRKAQDMSYMFHFTRELETIYVSDKWNTDLVTSSSDMFTYDDSLVGQKGTTYNENHIDKEYARVDDPDNNKPGYLTNKIPDTETYTIIYPDHFVTVPKGTQYTLDENTYTKASDTFDVTFKLLNGQDDIIRTVTKSYLPSGWIIDDEHYNAGDIFVVNKNITIVPDYSSVITPITFPSNPTRTNHSFTGWFDAVYGGNKYTSYAKDEEYTLYAHWNYVGPGGGSPTGDMLCLRATTLHEKECESTGACVNAGYEVGDTITYGNLGTLGTLNVGDAFTCDVNGDGTFDEETERFYYVSDYFNTSTKSFDTDVAALIWYTDTYTSWYAESEDDYTYNYNGPDDIYDDLPSYNYEWPNVRLKKKTRAILADDLADNMNMNKVAYQYYNDWTGSYSNTTHNLPTSFDYDDRSLAARLLTLPEVKSAYGWQYPNTTAYATASLPFMVENTNFASETENYEEYEYGPNGYWLETVQYDSGYNAYYLGSDRLGTEYADYSYGARPVIDVPKEQMEISDVAPGYYKITLPDRIEKVAAGSEFTVPYNTYAKSLVNGAYVNFYSNNGTATNNLPNYTRYVTKSYVANGFDSSDGVHYNDRDTFIVNKDLTLTPNNIEIENGVEFPEDPVKEGYTFDGWFDSNGVQYTEYYGTTNLYLYAQYTLIPPTPGLYTLPTNTKTKANDTYTVTFVYNNGSSNATRTVTVSYTPNGWLVDGVHHDNGETINYEEGMVITEDYTKTVTAATFPSNPSKTGYTFKGWFDVNTQAGGNKYTSYDKEADFTLYARFTIDNPIPEGTKCLRANTLHTGTLNNIPVTFGSLGTDGELNPGDAFTCDINGDGTFDEENERFYYVSDYYDTYTKEFDDDYAVLIWSQSSDESTHYTENRYADETDQYLLSEGPNYARLSLPDNWTNVGLKTSTRHIYAARGNDFNIESDQFEYSYIEYDTHMEPECVWHDAEYEEQECYYDYENQYCYTVPGEYHEGACNNPDDPWDCEPGYNDPDETICDDPEYVCPEPILIHEAGNVCEDVEVQTQTPKTDTYTWDYEENFSYSGYSARFLNAKELSQATGVTNFTRNAQIPISGNEYLLESGTDWFLENPQNMREPWNVTSQGKLYGDIEVDGGVVPAIDVPKENMEVDFLPKMHTITYPDGSTEEIEHGETFIFPNNTYDKGNESVATVTFNYGDGRDNTTSTVQKSFANNGFKVNGTHYDAGDSYIVNSDITLEGDYVETIIGAAFPENVERLAYNFEGWYTAPTEGAKVTSYTTEQDVTLYAHWTENVPTPGTLYTLPENNTPKEG